MVVILFCTTFGINESIGSLEKYFSINLRKSKTKFKADNKMLTF